MYGAREGSRRPQDARGAFSITTMSFANPVDRISAQAPGPSMQIRSTSTIRSRKGAMTYVAASGAHR
jgi:hypothetical protein